ncbi:Hypothetical protein, putative [Bodo saltans]|uniref:Uncharacterized protein n=1 Tax=Bodo saltans TaxID=75058 RepID=A0A0S4JBT6_BODSA|nr:Hypothetical protein, putative [Bodo saltans]|eukprot:CUG88862.1 Hypothetical protein, putative [Bodo saltans]
MAEQPDVSLLLKQLREDEQRLVRLRHNQNVEGSLGTVGKGTFDFPMPGAKPNRPIPTPPQRRGGGGANPKDHELGSFKVPVAPHLLEPTKAATSKKKFFPVIPLPPLTGANVPKVPTPRLTPSCGVTDDVATGEEEEESPRSVSRGSSRASSRRSSSSSRMTNTAIDPERFERLEQMLVEERAGRLDMLDKVNALSRLLADQNKKIVEGRRRARFMKR